MFRYESAFNHCHLILCKKVSKCSVKDVTFGFLFCRRKTAHLSTPTEHWSPPPVDSYWQRDRCWMALLSTHAVVMWRVSYRCDVQRAEWQMQGHRSDKPGRISRMTVHQHTKLLLFPCKKGNSFPYVNFAQPAEVIGMTAGITRSVFHHTRYLHNPYSSDGEDRQADRNDHPRRHDDHPQISCVNNNKHQLH